mgnify:CR=1 FL=1
MLTEKRQEEIVRLVQERESITVAELKDILQTSESTIRRDITSLDKEGRLTKVFGGAIALRTAQIVNQELSVVQKQELQTTEKQAIAQYAASLIEPDDCVYLDAGTTTEMIIDFLKEYDVIYVTNGITHARKLMNAGFKVHLIGGEIKAVTEAVVGEEALEQLDKYNFTKGFFGTNGLSRRQGYTTPDGSEALVKKTALRQCAKAYVLADRAKFDEVSSVTFAAYSDAQIITDSIPDHYKKYGNIIQV